jgi:hypothetical protein
MLALVELLACLALVGIATCGVYRLYFSSLAKVPGPKLAALTSLYELYYDLAENGRFPWKIRDLHRQYGLFPHIPFPFEFFVT